MPELITRNGGTMSSVNFMRIVKKAISDGIVDGCAIEKSGSTIRISAGHIIACGALVEIESTSLTVTASGELVLIINTGSTISAKVTARTSTTLTQQDLTNGGSTYELRLATYTYASGAVTSMSVTVENARSGPRITYGTGDPPAGGQDGDIYIKIV